MNAIGEASGIVKEIANASKEQAAGVHKSNGSIASMDEMTQQNSALVEESTASARTLSEQATTLADLLAFFKIDNTSTVVQQQKKLPPRTQRDPNCSVSWCR